MKRVYRLDYRGHLARHPRTTGSTHQKRRPQNPAITQPRGAAYSPSRLYSRKTARLFHLGGSNRSAPCRSAPSGGGYPYPLPPLGSKEGRG